MDDDDKDLLAVSGKIVRDAEWMLIIYQKEGDELPTFKLVHSPRFNQGRTLFRHVQERNLKPQST